MQLTTIIDVALGLMLLYLVLSLICTTINEFIAAGLGLRASNLAATVEQLIDDDRLRAMFYSHGMIVSSSLSSTAGDLTRHVTDITVTNGSRARPTYLDGKTVSRAIVDSLALLDPSKPFKTADDAVQLIETLPKGSVIRASLLANAKIAGDDIKALREGVANWFDSAMDRLSGHYNRQLKGISLLVGLLIAAALNADSLTIAKAIWTDDALRQQIAATSTELVHDDKLVSDCNQTGDAKTQIDCGIDRLGRLNGDLRPFPLGWPDKSEPQQGTDAWRFWFLAKVAGLLWTAVALSLGAPFWFDLLQRFMSLRGAGAKPASTTDPEPVPSKKVEVTTDSSSPQKPADEWQAKTKPG